MSDLREFGAKAHIRSPREEQLTSSAPGLVFWFADADAASQTTYPPTTFRWIDNQREAEEAVAAARRRAARRASEIGAEEAQ